MNMYRDELPIYSMNNVEYYGPLLSSVSFAEAVQMKRIVPLRIIISEIVDDNVLELLDSDNSLLLSMANGEDVILGSERKKAMAASIIAAREQLNTMIQTGEANKILVFMNNIEDCKRVTDINHPFSLISKSVTPYEYHSGLSTKQRHNIRHQFSTCKGPALCASVRAIREGVSINDVDTVILLRSYGQEDDEGVSAELVQHIGRAVRTSPNKEYANVVVPIPPVGVADTIRRRIIQMIMELMERYEILPEFIRLLEQSDNPITPGSLRDIGLTLNMPSSLSEQHLVEALRTRTLDHLQLYNKQVYDRITEGELIDFIDTLWYN